MNSDRRSVLFLCPHNAAKSVIAAAYFQRLVDQRGVAVHVDSAGTEPSAAVSPGVVAALRGEGIDVSTYQPRLVTAEEIAAAWRVVSMGCDLGHLAPEGSSIEHWDEVPSPTEGFPATADAINAHLIGLLSELETGHAPPSDTPDVGPDPTPTQGARQQGAANEHTGDERVAVSLRDLSMYFFRLGSLGFGGPIALAGYMKRDLEEERHWVTKDEFQDGLAIAQTMPGPLAAQLAMWIGFIRYGVLGATLTGVLFVITPFFLVLGVAAVYVALQGLSIIHALFYGIGPAAIAIIALAAWRLAKGTNARDPKLWATSAVLMVTTIVTQTELAWLFIVAGVLGILVYAPPWRTKPAPAGPRLAAWLPLPAVKVASLSAVALSAGTLVTLTLFFLKASAFTFGSGLAIVPFLHEGVVATHHWVTERQFLDAVAMGLITPGPVVIMATFVGYLAAGVAGACLATFGVFAPVWVINVVIGRLFLRHRQNQQVRAFVKGATAAAVGAIAGAAVILAQGGFLQSVIERAIHADMAGAAGALRQPGQGALVDAVTVAIFLVALVTLYLRSKSTLLSKLKEPYVVGIAAVAGLALFRFHG